jgi:uncharacterized membrane protein YphA (DoxX/SURF4 family)
MSLKDIDMRLIGLLRKWFLPLARAAIFVVYFYFGMLKIFDLSPAGPLAHALTERTIGAAHFDTAYLILAIFECVIGVLILFPKLTRVVIPLLFVHLLIVCSPLVLVADLAWSRPFVPTLEGQYIIKIVVLVGAAIVVGATVRGGRIEPEPRAPNAAPSA